MEYLWVFRSNLFKIILKTFWRYNFFIRWSMASKFIPGHIRPLLCKNHSSTFVCEPILIKKNMNANIMKTQFLINYIWPEMSLLCYGEFLWFFTFRPFDPITTLTYVLMDNFCPCLFILLTWYSWDKVNIFWFYIIVPETLTTHINKS